MNNKLKTLLLLIGGLVIILLVTLTVWLKNSIDTIETKNRERVRQVADYKDRIAIIQAENRDRIRQEEEYLRYTRHHLGDTIISKPAGFYDSLHDSIRNFSVCVGESVIYKDIKTKELRCSSNHQSVNIGRREITNTGDTVIYDRQHSNNEK